MKSRKATILWALLVIFWLLTAVGLVYVLQISYGGFEVAQSPDPQEAQWSGLAFLIGFIFTIPVYVAMVIYGILAMVVYTKIANTKRAKYGIWFASGLLGLGAIIHNILLILT
jgi:heme/copper-type cytochrome/quinol oxidase subunit 2